MNSHCRPSLLLAVLFTLCNLRPEAGAAEYEIRETLLLENNCLPEFKAISPDWTNIARAIKNFVIVEDFHEDEEAPRIAITLENADRTEGVGVASITDWQEFLECGNVHPPTDFHAITSETDFLFDDDNTYDLGTIEVVEPFGNTNRVCFIHLRDENFNPAAAVTINGDNKIILEKGDVLPREADPPLTGNIIVDIGGDGALSSTHVALAAYGNGFSGVYAWAFTNLDTIIPVVENLTHAGDPYGTIHFVDFASENTIAFTSETGLYSAPLLPNSTPELLVAAGEYAPGKEINNPTWFHCISSLRFVMQGFDENFNPTIYEVSHDGTNFTVKPLVGFGTPIPDGSGTFQGAQRPIGSEDWMIFEAFTRTGYAGAYTYIFENEEIIPLAERGKLLDGKSVQLAAFGRGSVSGNNLGLTVFFGDNTSGAYLLTLEAISPSIAFELDSLNYSPTSGFSGTFTGIVGESYAIEYLSGSATNWEGLVELPPASQTSINFEDPGAVNDSSRIYRARKLP